MSKESRPRADQYAPGTLVDWDHPPHNLVSQPELAEAAEQGCRGAGDPDYHDPRKGPGIAAVQHANQCTGKRRSKKSMYKMKPGPIDLNGPLPF